MLKTKEEAIVKDGVGVIVGRFQVAKLTEGHKALFDSVIQRHNKMICVVGLSPIRATKNNPMDFTARQKMIQETYPDVTVVYVVDNLSNETWSKTLDTVISTHIPPASKTTLYGSRDSFISYYSGRFETKELMQESYTNGTQERKVISYDAVGTEDFRRGVIWATQNQYDSCFPAVDIVIRKDDDILLARKPGEKKYRFVGGFVEPKGEYDCGSHLEISAKREVREETHLEVSGMKYIGSFLMDDWRYRSEKSKIMSTLFEAMYTFGRPEADDDIEELKWFSIESLLVEGAIATQIEPVHVPMMKFYITQVKMLNEEIENAE